MKIPTTVKADVNDWPPWATRHIEVPKEVKASKATFALVSVN